MVLCQGNLPVPALAGSDLAPAICPDLGALSPLSLAFHSALTPPDCPFLPVSPIPALLVPSLFMSQKLTSDFPGPEGLTRVDPPRLSPSAPVRAEPELRECWEGPGAQRVLAAAVRLTRAGPGRVRGTKDRGGQCRGDPGSAIGGGSPGLLPARGCLCRPLPALGGLWSSSGAAGDAAVSARGCAGRSYLRQQLNSLLSFPLRQRLNPFLPR